MSSSVLNARARPSLLPSLLAFSIFVWLGLGGTDDALLATLASAFYCGLLGLALLSGHALGVASRYTIPVLFASAALWLLFSATRTVVLGPTADLLTPDLLAPEAAKLAGYAACAALGCMVAANRTDRMAFERWLLRFSSTLR